MNGPSLAGKLLAIHHALDRGGIPHAFGGAIALAYLIEEPRATKDIDVNVFSPAGHVDRVFEALPPGVEHTARDAASVRRDAQVRLWWDHTPVDMFLDVDAIHRDAAAHARTVPSPGPPSRSSTATNWPSSR